MNIQDVESKIDRMASLAPLLWRNPSAAFLEQLPIAVYACDARGRMLWFNSKAVELWGRSPRIRDENELFCGSYKLFFDGKPISRERAPMAEVLRTGIPIRGVECRVERPDGSRIWTVVHIAPIVNKGGDIEGAISCFLERVDGGRVERRTEQSLARRMEEQAALFAFSERLQHCTSAGQVYDAALAAIIQALGCERASILLLDSANVMRFAAWRGLSESYRLAVEGHSPWAPDELDPRPVCVEDVASADLPDQLKQAIIVEGIQSAAFIPIVQEGRLAGKFMAYHHAPHRFGDAEIDTSLALARLLGFGLMRLAAEEARRAAERDVRQLAAIVESSDDAIVSKNLDGTIQTWNDAAERLFGYRKEEAIGQPIMLLIPPERQDEEPQILARIRNGERIHHFETVRRRKDGTLIDISLTISPIRDRAGRIVGASKIARDITERKLAEASLQENERRLQEVLTAIPAAIYTTDAEGRITYFNQTAVEFAGRMPALGSDEWCVTWKLFNPDAPAS